MKNLNFLLLGFGLFILSCATQKTRVRPVPVDDETMTAFVIYEIDSLIEIIDPFFRAYARQTYNYNKFVQSLDSQNDDCVSPKEFLISTNHFILIHQESLRWDSIAHKLEAKASLLFNHTPRQYNSFLEDKQAQLGVLMNSWGRNIFRFKN